MRRMKWVGTLLFLAALCAAQTAEEDRAKAQQECRECARVLVSRLDGANKKVIDYQRTESQAKWMEQDAKLSHDGKVKPPVWFTPFRQNAEYNVVWAVQLDSPDRPQRMDAWVWVYEIGTGRKLFQTWHHSIYWQKDHPELQCLEDAVKFLRTRKVTPNGVTFATSSDPGDYFPSPFEAR